ncbi:MAG: hypothetical protein Q9212_006050 [Teloschistes hypoglaucus]
MDRSFRHVSKYRSICAQCRTRLFTRRPFARSISMSMPKAADPSDSSPQTPVNAQASSSRGAGSINPPADPSALPSVTPSNVASQANQDQSPSTPASTGQAVNSNNFVADSPSINSAKIDSIGRMVGDNSSRSTIGVGAVRQPHHLHVYSTKHNTHITLTSPSRQPLISVSSGTIGFRKAMRGSYDAAYQLGSYVMGRIQQQGLLTQIHQLEVVLRDFGPGREAVTKILLGSEGKNIRGLVVRVCDATRLKFGGTRGKKPRRLG